MSTNNNNNNNNNNEDIDNNEFQQQDNDQQQQQQQPQVSTFNEQQRQIREQQQVIDKQNQLLQQHIQLINQQSQQQLNNHSTPLSSPNITIPITSAAITNTIKKSLGKTNTDDTNHQLLQVPILMEAFLMVLDGIKDEPSLRIILSPSCKIKSPNIDVILLLWLLKKGHYIPVYGKTPSELLVTNDTGTDDVIGRDDWKYGMLSSP